MFISFNVDVSGSDYIASNDTTANEEWIGKDMEKVALA